MAIIAIDSLADPRVADYQSVRDADLWRRRNLFVAEGRLVVERVISSGRYRIASILLSDTASSALAPALECLEDVPAYVCAAAEFKQLGGLNLHRGCLALVERPAPRTVADVTERAHTLVVLEDLADPDNVGGIFRNVAAFAGDAVLMSPGCVDPLYRKAMRTSMGAALSVPFARLESWPADLARLRDAGFLLIALTPQRPALTVDELASGPRPDRVALLLGGEGPGLSGSALRLADIRVRIPISAAVDSLNVAVACGIVLSRFAGPARDAVRTGDERNGATPTGS